MSVLTPPIIVNYQVCLLYSETYRKVTMMIKRAFMGGVALLTLGGVSTAADLRVVPNKAPPYLASPAAFNWSGLYVGAEAGYGISSIDLDTVGINSGID